MNKKLGLLVLYALLIDSALGASSRDPIKSPLTIIVAFSILAILLVLITRQRRQNR
ncbi:MAG TPA: hypothetical protein VK897_20105 [Anaerolineales bacterium]|nr:hypothetical protein [Anaerolineales bacterium]